MKYLTLLLLTLTLTSSVYAQINQKKDTLNTLPQHNEKVSLKERVTGKRKSLYLINNDSVNHSVFFTLSTDDYVVNDPKPITITLKPNTEVKVASMVLIDGKKGRYDYTLKVNEVGYELDLKKDGQKFNPQINKGFKTKDITIFIKKDCQLCADIKRVLKRSRVPFNNLYFKRDSVALNNLLNSYGKNRSNVIAPVVKINDSLYTSIKTPRDLIEIIAKNIN